GRCLAYHYPHRAPRTEVVPTDTHRPDPPTSLSAQTGIQRLPINTLYQLASMRGSDDPQLAAADTLLLIPDLFHYWLTGNMVAEYTNATTTQLFDARERRWATELLDELDLPARILPPVVAPGTVLGELLPDVR